MLTHTGKPLKRNPIKLNGFTLMINMLRVLEQPQKKTHLMYKMFSNTDQINRYIKEANSYNLINFHDGMFMLTAKGHNLIDILGDNE